MSLFSAYESTKTNDFFYPFLALVGGVQNETTLEKNPEEETFKSILTFVFGPIYPYDLKSTVQRATTIT